MDDKVVKVEEKYIIHNKDQNMAYMEVVCDLKGKHSMRMITAESAWFDDIDTLETWMKECCDNLRKHLCA